MACTHAPPETFLSNSKPCQSPTITSTPKPGRAWEQAGEGRGGGRCREISTTPNLATEGNGAGESGVKGTGPVCFFDRNLSAAVVISPFSQFMAASSAHVGGSLAYGRLWVCPIVHPNRIWRCPESATHKKGTHVTSHNKGNALLQTCTRHCPSWKTCTTQKTMSNIAKPFEVGSRLCLLCCTA